MSLLSIIFIILIIMFSMTLHEMAHAWVGYWLGDDTAKLQGRLSFNPIKHIDPFLTIILPILLLLTGLPVFGGAKPVPFNQHNIKWGDYGAALIALAGPTTNFLIAFLFFGVWVVIGFANNSVIDTIFGAIINVNLGFFVFNMLPVPPLDGSRLMYALAPDFVRRGMESIEQFGTFFVFMILLLVGPAIGVFMSNIINYLLNLFMLFFGM